MAILCYVAGDRIVLRPRNDKFAKILLRVYLRTSYLVHCAPPAFKMTAQLYMHLRIGLVVMAGGACGGGLRYGLIQLFPYAPGDVPWVIFGENIAGAFLLGWIGRWLIHEHPDRVLWRLFLTTGLLGSFTTFSTYALDLVHLAESGRMVAALGYAFGSMLLGLGAALAGLVAADRRYASKSPVSNL